MQENRLVSAGGGSNAQLRYDPLGRLYQTGGGTPITRFLYDGDELIAEYDGSGTMQRRYVHCRDVDDPVVWFEGASTSNMAARMVNRNWQGSVVSYTTWSGQVMTFNAGQIVAINAYDEWGIPKGANTPANAVDDNIGRFQYTGQAWIPELGMYYYKARIYSPTLGRFLQTDPIGYEDQVNFYAYVGNDPVNAVDPDGHSRRRVTPPVSGPRLSESEIVRARRAEEAEENLRRIDPEYRDPGTLRAFGSAGSRVAYSESYYVEAAAARIAIGMSGQSPVGGTIRSDLMQVAIGRATYIDTTANGPHFTRQYTGSGSGLDALRGIVGNNYTSEQNGSFQARNVELGNGLTANINLHRGGAGESGSARSGYVLNIQIDGVQNRRVLNVKIEYPSQ